MLGNLRNFEKLKIISLCGVRCILIVHQIMISFYCIEWPINCLPAKCYQILGERCRIKNGNSFELKD